jgi:hypothetical protein
MVQVIRPWQPCMQRTYISLNLTICKLQQANTRDKIKAFNWFFGEFVECKSGKRVWSRHKYHILISEAVNWDTGVQIITVSDEAFGLLLNAEIFGQVEEKMFDQSKWGCPRQEIGCKVYSIK